MENKLEEKLLLSVQKIWEMNGRNRTNRLRDGFKINFNKTDEGSWEIVISNEQHYFKYLAEGTYERKGQGQKGFPIIRKYTATPPIGYPQVRGSYPYDLKGIEAINFSQLLFEEIKKELIEDFAKFYIENIKLNLEQ